eukprot:superscaffoldBa00004744_g19385
MDEAGEWHAEGESGDQDEREEVKIIQMALLPNEAIKEGEGGGERLEENGEGDVELGDEQHEKTDEQKEGTGKGVERSKDTKTVTENSCYFSAMIEVEKDKEQISHSDGKHEEDSEKEENNQDCVKASVKEEREEKTSEADRGLEEHQIVSTTDNAETTWDTQNSGADAQKSDEVEVVANETSKSSNESQNEMKNTDEKLTVMDEGEQSTEEKGKTGDNVVRELTVEEVDRGRDDLEMQEETIVQLQNQAPPEVAPPEPVLQCLEDLPLDTQLHVDLDQVEEAFELEEGSEVDLNQPRGEVKLDENESATEGGGDLQEHPSQLLKEARADTLWEQLREPALVEDEKGVGTEEEAMEGDVEMAEEPVTVLDDEIEETEESQRKESEEQKPATILITSEDAAVKTKDGVHQELEGEKVKLGKENDEKQKDNKDKKPKYENPEVELDIHGRVKGLKQAMENGILCPEPQPFRKEGWGTSRLLSLRRKDDDWIKKDQPEEERAPEMKDWRKDLKPLKKDIWESERERKEWMNKEPMTKEKSPPRKEDWIKELKSVIKDESQPKKRDEQVKKKRVVLLEDGHSYIPQQEEMTEERREEVKLISHRRVESPLPPLRRNSRTSQDQEYEISLYVKGKGR